MLKLLDEGEHTYLTRYANGVKPERKSEMDSLRSRLSAAKGVEDCKAIVKGLRLWKNSAGI